MNSVSTENELLLGAVLRDGPETEVGLSDEQVAQSAYVLAKNFYDKADLDNAEKYFLMGLEKMTRPRDNFSLFKTLGFLIRIASEKLEDHKAEAYIRQAATLIEETSSNLGTLNAEYFYNVGIVKNYQGDFDQARENFLLCYRKSKEENEPELLSKCLLALAINGYNRKSFDEALDYIEKLDQLLKIINKSYLSGAMHMFNAKILLEVGRVEEAIDNFSKANKILQRKKCWNLFGYILLGKGMVHKIEGDYTKSLTYYNLAKESLDLNVFKRLGKLLDREIEDVNDSAVDIYLDRTNRKVKEKTLGIIDFKHRFVLLEILFLLARNPGSYYDKEELARSIWRDEYNPLIHDKLIYTSVSRLRKLIEPKSEGTKRKYIIRGKDGYTFNPDVRIRFHKESKIVSEKVIGNVDLSSPV
ncbi:MAG: winged helix-turn-helix domain-containing protein [Bacteriovoracaceae bacterium]